MFGSGLIRVRLWSSYLYPGPRSWVGPWAGFLVCGRPGMHYRCIGFGDSLHTMPGGGRQFGWAFRMLLGLYQLVPLSTFGLWLSSVGVVSSEAMFESATGLSLPCHRLLDPVKRHLEPRRWYPSVSSSVPSSNPDSFSCGDGSGHFRS